MTRAKSFSLLAMLVGLFALFGTMTMGTAEADEPPTFTNPAKGGRVFIGTDGTVIGKAETVSVLRFNSEARYAVLHFVFEDDTPDAADFQNSHEYSEAFLETCAYRMGRYASLLSIGYGGKRTMTELPGARNVFDIAGINSPLLSRYLGPGPDCLATGMVGALIFDSEDRLLGVFNPVLNVDGRRAFAQDENGTLTFPHTKRVKVSEAEERCQWANADGERVWFCYPVEGDPVYEVQTDWTTPQLMYPDTHKTAAATVRFP